MKIEDQEKQIINLKKEIEILKRKNSDYLRKIEEDSKKEPETLLKIVKICNEHGLSQKQKEEVIKKAIRMADEYRKLNQKN